MCSMGWAGDDDECDSNERNNNFNNVGAPQDGQGGNNITVTAIVSETEMTSTQDRVNRIKRNAEL